MILQVLYFFIVSILKQHIVFKIRYVILFKKEVVKMKKSTLSVERCKTISTVQKILGGKWKIEIIYYIAFQNIHRFGELRRHIGDITESSLAKQLRELEADGFISRYDYKEIPLRVEYNLTELGKSFIPVLKYMKQWGDENLNVQ